VANEGVRIAMIGDKDTMVIGANGDTMHSLAASQAGRIELSILKTAPVNALLNALYRAQDLSAATWGNIQININNPVTGDVIVGVYGAFVKLPDLVYATQGNIMVWAFNMGYIDETLGNGYNPTGF